MLEYSKLGQRFSVDFEFEIPEWYKEFYFETCLMYYHSCSRDPRVAKHNGVSYHIKQILFKYFESIRVDPKFIIFKKTKSPPKIKYDLDDQKIAVAYSGGKDCVYMVQKLIDEGVSPKNILNLYVPNINKSESHYEKIAVKKTSEYLGCNYHIIPVKNSIKVNRSGHNIGTREQLIAGMCLPYMIQFGAKKLYFGLKYEHLFTDRKDIFDHYQEAINRWVPGIELIPYGPLVGLSDLQIAKDIDRSLLDITSSCYTQINFREKRNKAITTRFPSLDLYNGCGQCQKCMIINGAIYLNHPGRDYDFEKFYENKFKDKFQDNKDIKQALEEMKS